MDFNPKQLEIVRIAERLFAERGFSGTSIRDISQEAGINVSMISYYFGSKEKLIEAVFSVRSADLLRQFDALLQQTDISPIQRVNLMVDAVLERLIEKKCFHNIMVREQLSGNSRTPLITHLIQGIKRKQIDAMQSILKEGQKKGDFRKDINVLMLYSTLFGTINQALTTIALYRSTNHLEKLSDEDLEKHLKKNLGIYLKQLFQSMLTPVAAN